MKLRLVRLTKFSGEKASIYTVLDVQTNTNPFSEFLNNWKTGYDDKQLDMVTRLVSMGQETGVMETFFKLDEGREPEDLVCALYDRPDKEMRLYCMRLSEKTLVVGNGAPKPPHIRAWQDDESLKTAAEQMIFYSDLIRKAIKRGTLVHSETELGFRGNLFIQ